jgi:hypothetical protein
MKEFLNELRKETTSTIVLDFDGVIHKGSKGFHDGTIYDDPVDGTEEALKILSTKFKLVISTCKADPKRPLVNGKTGTELVWQWLDKHNFAQYIEDVTDKKVRALYYIDDKGITFESWKKILEILLNINN